MEKFDKKRKFNKVESEFENRLIDNRRVAKVVKGGRNFSQSVLVVSGDKKGRVGIGSAKAIEFSTAFEKACKLAAKNMVKVHIVGTTIPHEIYGKASTSRVLLKPAKEGSGVKAGSAARAVLELAGYKDVVSKSYGGRNKINTVKATLDGLMNLRTAEEIAETRGKSVKEIL